jgi:hypothetical protein
VTRPPSVRPAAWDIRAIFDHHRQNQVKIAVLGTILAKKGGAARSWSSTKIGAGHGGRLRVQQRSKPVAVTVVVTGNAKKSSHPPRLSLKWTQTPRNHAGWTKFQKKLVPPTLVVPRFEKNSCHPDWLPRKKIKTCDVQRGCHEKSSNRVTSSVVVPKKVQMAWRPAWLSRKKFKSGDIQRGCSEKSSNPVASSVVVPRKVQIW